MEFPVHTPLGLWEFPVCTAKTIIIFLNKYSINETAGHYTPRTALDESYPHEKVIQSCVHVSQRTFHTHERNRIARTFGLAREEALAVGANPTQSVAHV